MSADTHFLSAINLARQAQHRETDQAAKDLARAVEFTAYGLREMLQELETKLDALQYQLTQRR